MKPTIVGGHDAEKDRFKYIVSLTTNSGRHVCGGSLIASDIVLTAAHCEGYFSKVVVGLYHNTDDHLQETESFNVTGTIVHPFYDQKFLRYDFLVVKLDNHSSYPIVSLDVDHKLTTTSILVLGWGITDSDNRTPYVGPLQVAFLKYIPNDICSDSDGFMDGSYASYEGLITESMLCAVSPGTHACSGDSGGPLILKGNNDKEDVQIGIVSWGFECGNDSFPGVYSRVRNQFSWIQEIVCILSDDVPSQYTCKRRDNLRRPIANDCNNSRHCQKDGFDCVSGKCLGPRMRHNYDSTREFSSSYKNIFHRIKHSKSDD